VHLVKASDIWAMLFVINTQEKPMSRRRIDVRKLREIIRLHYQAGLSANKIATSVNISRSAVQEYLRRARFHELSWPLPDSLDDAQLETLLYPSQIHGLVYSEPAWELLHRQLKEKGVTRELIWLEYKSDCHSLGRVPYSYQQYCKLYQIWAKNITVVMRQEHLAGQKLFVDFAGKTIPVVDAETGEVTQAQLFVAVLGASNYTYVEVVHLKRSTTGSLLTLGLFNSLVEFRNC